MEKGFWSQLTSNVEYCTGRRGEQAAGLQEFSFLRERELMELTGSGIRIPAPCLSHQALIPCSQQQTPARPKPSSRERWALPHLIPEPTNPWMEPINPWMGCRHCPARVPVRWTQRASGKFHLVLGPLDMTQLSPATSPD